MIKVQRARWIKPLCARGFSRGFAARAVPAAFGRHFREKNLWYPGYADRGKYKDSMSWQSRLFQVFENSYVLANKENSLTTDWQTEKKNNENRKDEFKLQWNTTKNAVTVAISNDARNSWNFKISGKVDEQLRKVSAFRRWQTRTNCCGNIVARDVSLRAQTGKHLLRTQNVSEQNQKHFCVPDAKFVSATKVARAGKRGNISVGNNASATMCPCLPVPLHSKRNLRDILEL